MPMYSFINMETGEETEELLSIAAYEQYLIDHPKLKRIPSAARIVGHLGDRVKSDEGFKEVLSKVGERYPYTPLGERYGPKDKKTAGNREVIKKMRQGKYKR